VTFHSDNSGVTTFAANDAKVKITASSLYPNAVAEFNLGDNGIVTGIDSISGDSNADIVRPNDIYNLQGIMIKRNATQADIDNLAPGLYIIAGKKVLVK